MPGFDRQGPNGEGPMTGRKMGRCNPDNIDKPVSETEVQDNSFRFGRGRGRRFGKGLGLGRGMANRFRGNW